MQGSGGLAWQAREQLAAWEAIAAFWGVHLDRSSMCCDECGKGVWLAMDEHGQLYRYTPEQELALKVLHLRNHHADLDPNG